MERNIRLNDFESNEPQPQWLNQLRVTLAMGKRYEQKGDMEKAANCYENVLYYAPNDTMTSVKLSKCYQKMLLPEQAVPLQNHAMQNDPHLFQTVENEASLNFELGNIEKCLIAYNTLSKQLKTSSDCQRGLIKANEVMENNMPINGLLRSLRTNILEMIEKNQFFNDESTHCQIKNIKTKSNTFLQAQTKRIEEAYYLRYVTENVKYYRKQLKDLPKFHRNDKTTYENFQKVILTFEKAKEALCRQNPFYTVTSRRPRFHFNDAKKIKKDMIRIQVAKYVNAIVTHCLDGRIIPAQRQAELALKYMDSHGYKPLEIVNKLYEILGLAWCSVNQDMVKWSNELNDKRILFIMGSNVDTYNNLFYESYFGPQKCSIVSTLKNLSKQLQENKKSAYTMYLQYERIKCYLELKSYKKTRLLSNLMFTDACDLGSIAWQVNALMMTVISESRLGSALKCTKVLDFIIPLSITLGNENITQFLRKIRKFFAEDKVPVHIMSAEEKRKADLVDIMPDPEATRHMRDTLCRIDKLPRESRMPVVLGELPEINCAVIRRRAWRKPYSTTNGDKAC